MKNLRLTWRICDFPKVFVTLHEECVTYVKKLWLMGRIYDLREEAETYMKDLWLT